MSTSPLPAEEGGRPTTCAHCRATGVELKVYANGVAVCEDAAACLDRKSGPASVVSSEEGGRATVWENGPDGYNEVETGGRDLFAWNRTIQQMNDRPASVVGDASEGEADALIEEVRQWLGMARQWNASSLEAATLCTRLAASLRSTRAALEEARAAIRAHLAECVPCENEHCGDADCASRRALRAAIPSQESTKV